MERSVVVRYRVVVDDAKAKSKEFAAAVGGVADKAKSVGPAAKQGFSEMLTWADKNSAHLNALSMGIGLVGAGLTGMAALAVKKFADFDQAMSNVIATGDDARLSQEALREAAIRAGADTVFSATESANAIEEMAKAGVSAADILDGGLAGALDLAAAGSLEVADAAGIAATVMNQFGLGGRDVIRIADTLAASAGKANGEVADFGLAMKYVGPVAAQLGISLEETSGTLALLAQNGILADSAGTGLRGVLMSMTAPTKVAQKAMAEYGISAFDAAGEFVGLEALAGQLQDRLGGLTEAERSAALGRMFGNEQITTARILYKEGASAVADWTSQVDDSGYAAETAAAKLDNLKGDWEALMGAVDTALIQGGSGANEGLRGLVQGAESVVDAIGQLPEPILQATTLLTGAGGLTLLGVAGLIKLVTGISEAKAALDALKISAGTARVAVAAVGSALAVGTIALMLWADRTAKARERMEGFKNTLDDVGNATDATTRHINELITTTEVSWWQDFRNGGATIAETAEKMGISVEDVRASIEGNADAIARVQAGMDAYSDGASFWSKQFGGAATDVGILSGFIEEYHDSNLDAAETTRLLAEENREAGVATGEYGSALESAAGSSEFFAAAQEEASEELADWLEMVSEADGSFVNLLGAYDSVIAKSKEAAEKQADDTKSTKDSWEDFYDGMSVSIADYLTELEKQVEAQQNWETNMLLLSARVSQGVLDELAAMGPEGAPLVADLVDASDDELARMEELWGERAGNATNAFANTLRGAGPVLAEVMRVAGADAADAAAAALASGETDLQSVINQYDLNIDLGASTSHAQSIIDAFVSEQSKRAIRLNVSANTGSTGATSVTRQANGGLWGASTKTYANGGVNALGQMIPRVPQIAKGGANILWGEPETGWEAYISGKPSELARNREIHAEAGRRLGVESVPLSARYAAGHITGSIAPVAATTGPSIVLNTPVEAFLAAADQIGSQITRQMRLAANAAGSTAYSRAVSTAAGDLNGQAVGHR